MGKNLIYEDTAVLKSLCLLRNGSFESFLSEMTSNSIDGKSTILTILIYKNKLVFIDNSLGFNIEFLKQVGGSTKRPIEDDEENSKNNLPYGYQKDIRKINAKIKNDPDNEDYKKTLRKFKNHITSLINIQRETIGQKGLGMKSLYNSFNIRYYSHFSVFESSWTINEKSNTEEYSDKYNIDKFRFSINDIPINKGVYGSIIILEPRFPLSEYTEKWNVDFKDEDDLLKCIKEYFKTNKDNIPSECTIIIGKHDGYEYDFNFSENLGEYKTKDPFTFFNAITELTDDDIENNITILNKINSIKDRIIENSEENDSNFDSSTIENYADLKIENIRKKEKINANKFETNNYKNSIQNDLFKLLLNSNKKEYYDSNYVTILGGFQIKENNFLDKYICSNDIDTIIKNGVLIITAEGLNETRTDIIPHVKDLISNEINKIYSENAKIEFIKSIYTKGKKILENYNLNIDEIIKNYSSIFENIKEIKDFNNKIKNYASTINFIIKCVEIETKIISESYITQNDCTFNKSIYGSEYFNDTLYSEWIKIELLTKEPISNAIVSLSIKNGNIEKTLNIHETLEIIKTIKFKSMEEIFKSNDKNGYFLINKKILTLFNTTIN